MIISPSVRRGVRELSRSDIDRLVDENGRLRAEVCRLEDTVQVHLGFALCPEEIVESRSTRRTVTGSQRGTRRQ